MFYGGKKVTNFWRFDVLLFDQKTENFGFVLLHLKYLLSLIEKVIRSKQRDSVYNNIIVIVYTGMCLNIGCFILSWCTLGLQWGFTVNGMTLNNSSGNGGKLCWLETIKTCPNIC